jgi:hypothetical protein
VDRAKGIIWIRMLKKEFQILEKGSSLLFCYNQRNIQLIKNTIYHARTKHIEIQHHFVKENINKNEIEITYIGKHNQQVDILTKPFGRVIFITMHQNLGIENLFDLVKASWV